MARSGAWRAAQRVFALSCALATAACATVPSLDEPPAVAWAPVAHLTQAQVVHAAMATDGQAVHVAHGDGTLYHRRSLDQGATWSAWTNLGRGTLYLEDPIAVQGSIAAIVTVDATDAVFDFFGRREVGDLYVRVSNDAGASWGAPQRLTHGGKAFRVSLAISNATLHLAWMDFRTGSWEIRYLRSEDSGATWTSEIIIADGLNVVGAERPTIEAHGQTVHLAWMDARDAAPSCEIERRAALPICTEIYYGRSTDGGLTWAPARRLTFGPGYAGRPDLLDDRERILIAYDRRSEVGVSSIGLLRSQDGGSSWSDGTLASGAHDYTHARLASRAGEVHAMWMELAPDGARLLHSVAADGEHWAAPALVPGSDGAGAPSLGSSVDYIQASWAAHSLTHTRY